MQAFAYVPGGPENLEAFNARVADFCLSEDACVVAIQPQLCGSALVLSLTQLEDIGGVSLPVVQMPVVFQLSITDLLTLEAKLDECIASIASQDSEEETRAPMGVRTLFDDKSGAIFVVVDVNVGEVDVRDMQEG